MKKNGILNKDISQIIASMGHFDQLTICDAGLPIPSSVNRIELILTKDLPRFLDVVKPISDELCIQRIFLAEEIKNFNQEIFSEVKELFSDIEIEYIPHSEFKALTKKSKAIIRTGECSPYANVIFESGVIF